jgi:HAD superfamily phosphatase (TIGR01668 family)
MPKILPKWYSKSIYDIDLEKLKTLNIKYVLSDLDNTLVGFDVAEPTEKVHDFIKQLKDNDLELIVVSNNNSKRLNKFCNPCSLKFLSSARKPSSKKLSKFLKANCFDTKDCVFVGDQLLTDMWCANKAGCISILVDPLQKKESKLTFFNRKIDRHIRKRYLKQGKLVSIMKGE